MADIDFKNSVNADSAYVENHKVQLIAIPDGDLELPLSPNDDSGYVVDANGKKHKVMLATFLTSDQDIEYKNGVNANSAYMTVDGQKVKVTLAAKLNGTQRLFDSPNASDAYVEDEDGNEHRTMLVATPEGTLELPTSETYNYAYVVDGDGNKHRVRMFAVLAGGQAYVEVTVKGVSPLSLPDAIADSLSYVKAFGGTEQRNLPDGYTQLEYIESTGTQYIDLGYKGNGNTKVDVKFKYHTETSASGSGRVFGSRTNATTNAFATGSSSGTVSATTNKIFWCYDSQPVFVDNTDFGLDVWKTVVFSATEHSIDGVSVGDDYNIVEFETPSNLMLFAFDTNDTIGVGYIDVAYCKLWDNGVLIRDLVPVKNSSNVVGMYDLVSGQFFTNDGTGDFVAGPDAAPTPDTPMDIVSNNGVLKVSPNLFNPATTTNGFINASGVVQSSDTLEYSALIPVVAGETYTWSGYNYSSLNTTNKRLHGYDSNGNWVAQLLAAGVAIEAYSITATIPSGVAFVRLSGIRIDTPDTNVQLELGATATPYMPYGQIYTDGTVETIEDTIGNTATTEMLLKVGDYQDEQDIPAGVVTRNVGVKVLDGTETGWVRGANSIYIDGLFNDAIGYSADNPAIICSHFRGFSSSATVSTMPDLSAKLGASNQPKRIYFVYDAMTTATQFQQWLAQQYNAGTPVIVLYPLATPTTESVTGQTLQVTNGDNVLEITQASLNGLELEAEYQAAVALTIQEVQDAQLSPDVEITIQ